MISCSSVRIGLIFSAEPSHADAAPMRPPRRRYSSVSTANHIFSSRARSCGRARPPRPRPARLRRARPGERHQPQPPAALSESITVTRSTPLRCGQLLLGLPGALDRAGDAARDVDRDDVEALVDERLVDLQEVADRRLGGGRQPVGGAQAVVEIVEVRHVGLPLARVLPVDVEADELDAVALDELRGQVGRGVRDNRDALHRTLLPLRAAGRGAATMSCTLLSPAQGWTAREHRRLPRRFMVTLTDKAATKVKELMNGQADEPAPGLRVAVRGGGCSGFQYALAFDEQRDGDQIFEHPGDPAARRLREPALRGRLRGRLRRGPPGRGLRGEQPERGRILRLRPVVQNGLARS